MPRPYVWALAKTVAFGAALLLRLLEQLAGSTVPWAFDAVLLLVALLGIVLFWTNASYRVHHKEE